MKKSIFIGIILIVVSFLYSCGTWGFAEDVDYISKDSVFVWVNNGGMEKFMRYRGNDTIIKGTELRYIGPWITKIENE